MEIPDILKDNPILEGVLNKLVTQTQKGLEKYGTTVNADMLSMIEWINHAQEEIIDLLVYLETMKVKASTIQEVFSSEFYTQLNIDFGTGEKDEV